MKKSDINRDLLKYIEHSTSPFHVIKESRNRLDAAGFESLELGQQWNLKEGKKYYVCVYGTTLIAFTIGQVINEDFQYRIAAAHTDHPCFKIKPHAEMVSDNYMKLNTDVYGGPIVNTWLDRPLSIAGKVALRSKDMFHPEIRLVDFKRPMLTIPNLAIHMNREVNKGVELNRQIDTLPVLGLINDSLNKDNFFLECLAKELEVDIKDILDFDLYIYNTEQGTMIGMNEDMISSPRLDNLTSCYALLDGMLGEQREHNVNVAVLFDNEEIGSKTKQGADSTILSIVLEKISSAFGIDRSKFHDAILNSLFLSVDVAHATHSNHPEKNDPTNKVLLDHGFVLKLNSNQRYATDSEAVAIIQQICDQYEIKYQKFVNRSDMIGGGTLGSITSSWLPMKTIDIGVPILAMHSAREVMGAMDQTYLNQLLSRFYAIND